MAASHRTWNVTFCDENVTSLIFVPVTNSKPGLGSGNFSATNDPESGKICFESFVWENLYELCLIASGAQQLWGG